MQDDIAQLLLGSIEADRLAIFTGAGLSMAAPSAVPSAARLAEAIAKKYESNGALPAGLNRADLEQVTRLIYANNHSELLLNKIVDWKPFRINPNSGHAAVADLLECAAFEYGVTTNYDVLVENAAATLGDPTFRSSIDGVDAEENRGHRPYVKAHGCCVLNIRQTIWFREQLTNDPSINVAHERTRNWLRARMQNKDLLFVGFWSDWAYLNEVLERLLDVRPMTVIVVDPQDDAALQAKAPRLWQWATSCARFEHVAESGADFLDDLRRRFSIRFLNDMMAFGGTDTFMPTTSTMDATALRRDACGVPVGSPLRTKRPDNRMEAIARAHHDLRARGVLLARDRYELAGKTIRVVNGGGRMLNTIRAEYNDEPPGVREADWVLCAGALDDGGAPPHLLRGTAAPTLVRPGSTARWVTRTTDIEDLNP